ncbi:E3 ubiquitin-protein ligase PRT6 [Asparagus officinalis]|uniref:E3 ubiquitin-protein ligase PRT6 n=1 Tax=Asparagus officinalis TaxID=4686 RepID=UPI00098E48BE|nr:E3 ubiquitin-protein ligase PRT6 [Asparagus officinalis]XP_020273461.1 E3 ubiquitin-protein ligase PRT6 [Asparagus officinalis]
MMAGMEIDSPPPEKNPALSPRERIVQRIVKLGIPLDQIDPPTPSFLVDFMKHTGVSIPNLVSSILPTDEDVAEIRRIYKKESGGGTRRAKLKKLYAESLLWIQWMMFGCDPQACLKEMAERAAGHRAVCGSVWGQNDLAYRCRTCEHDPTCAICVPCFKNGNHKDHDYSIMYTGGGCCDCGDETAWKREGFCSKHKGIQQIQPLSEELERSVGPVIDILLTCWRDKVVSAEHWKHARDSSRSDIKKVADEFSSAVVSMLLDFCNCSESLLSFISGRISECSCLIDVLVRAERFLDKEVVNKLHELLLKLIGEPLFKYEFAKSLIEYYPVTVNEIIKESSDSMLEKYTLLSTFSVQIFTVPVLTSRLVREVDLLGILLGCLMDIFISCVGEDGRLQVSRWSSIYDTTLRLVEDTRYVMSHDEVSRYIAEERPDIPRAWLRLLSLVQGMDPQRRTTGIHTEDDNDNVPAAFALCYYLGNVHSLLVGAAFSVAEPKETKGDKGLLHPSSSDCSISCPVDASNHISTDRENCPTIPTSAMWLISECLKTIENWLEPCSTPRGNLFSSDASGSNGSSIFTLGKKSFSTRKSRNRVNITSLSGVGFDGDQVPSIHERLASSPASGELEAHVKDDPQADVSDNYDMVPEFSSKSVGQDASFEEISSGRELEAFRIFNLVNWPIIEYDVSSQEISFHIPLHRFLSLLLRKALKTFYEKTGILVKANDKLTRTSSHQHEFFGQVLEGVHPCGFSAYIMENPLRLRVFCAQVRAGMWRRNGDAAILSCEWYRSFQWLEVGLEPDLFLLQCCAALAPPDSFVKRIQERFGLSNYTSLNLADHNEYEAVLVQEMLTLIIQIVKERRFCGLSTTENLRRELVYKLAIGDATHSQIVKSLPRDLSKCDQLRSILDTIAVYSKPSGMKQGKYSLRETLWKELDLYHPRWNSRDLQVAEERYLRFCKVSALNAQVPRWTAIFGPLLTISRIATSKSIVQIIRAVIFYAVFTETSPLSRAPDSVLITALHLLSLALDVCETQLPCDQKSCIESIDTSCQADDLFPILTYASEEFDMGAAGEVLWKNQSLLSLLVSLMRKHKEQNDYSYAEIKQCNISSLIENLLMKFAQLSTTCLDNLKRLAPELICNIPQHQVNTTVGTFASTSDLDARRARARERQAAIMEKMKAEQSKFIASLNSEGNGETYNTKSDRKVSVSVFDDTTEESAPICSLCRGSDTESPLCFLILLQKSRLTSFVESGPISWDDIDKSDKEKHTISTKGEQSGNASTAPVQLVQGAGPDVTYGIEPAEINVLESLFGEFLPERRGTQPTTTSYYSSTSLPSTLEMLENDAYQSIVGEICALNGQSYCSTSGAAVHTQQIRSAKSYMLRGNVASLSRKASQIHQASMYHIHAKGSDSTVPATRFSGIGPRNCDGIHISSCGHAVHQECHDRYLTSLKQRHLRRLGFEGGHIVDPDLGELLCPVCRRFANSILPAFPSGISNKLVRRIVPIESPKENLPVALSLALSLLKSTAKIVGHGRFRKALSGKQNVNVKSALEPAFRKLCMLYSVPGYDNLLASGRLHQSLILWDTFMYTLVSTEIAARGKPKKCLSSSLSLEALYAELGSDEFILSLLLSIAQTARFSSQHDVLLRFRGIQLLAGSICFGVSGDKSSISDEKKGHADKGESFPDTLFFGRVADPILAHDPFSSLVWTLFCLPSPFISSSEFLIPLVHLFYYVCVVQALVTCYNEQHFDFSCFGDGVLNDICKMMGECDYVRKYFLSNYIDISCHPKDMIRRLTFPYLRRCALLCKMLESSMPGPLFESSCMWKSNPCASGSVLDSVTTEELNGVNELENMFQIHSLESVLENEFMHSLAVTWCNHFCKEFSVRNNRTVLFSTPAVPFKLIQLPRLYQDLLQRYIKQQCSNCKSVPEEPALCLLCSRLCSPNWKSCCRASKCLNHATVCGAGIGVFLLIRRTTVFLQRSLRESAWPSPYLDAFGEEDRDMHRGRPLYLNEERYAALTYLVASHGLDRTSEVLRQTTIGLNGPE